MNEIGAQAQKLMLLLKPMVAMIVKEIRPMEDEISANAAYKSYGRKWVEKHRREGNLHEWHKGNRTIFSRAEIESLICAERETPQLIFRANKDTGYVSTRDEKTGKLIIRKQNIKTGKAVNNKSDA